MKKLELKISAEKEDILQLFADLDDEVKDAIIDTLTWDRIVERTSAHIKDDTDFWGYTTNGYRHGGKIREELAKIQGLEPAWKRDYETKIQSLEIDLASKKKYYDWYFKVCHDEEAYEVVRRRVGTL